ncbi:MAG TPA: FAD-dependent oxidoreductase [Armatimonadota bacterium]|jgi:NAD(P)H-nitrite reductase large subunit
MSDKRYDYVIVGNSTAAVAAVESLRTQDMEGTLAVISREPQAAYCAPLITYVLAGKIPEEQLAYRPADFYERMKVETLLGAEVTELRPEAHEVVLADGTTIGYGKLLLATGGTPIVPPLPGVDLAGVYTFTRYEDMCRVREYLEHRQVNEAVVVGGGMIGVKTAEALVKLGIKTTIVELLDRVLAQALDEKGSVAARRALADGGVRVVTSTGATGLGGSEVGVVGVQLDSGETLPAQLVIMAIGVRPNTTLAQAAGCAVKRGVIVNDHMQTSLPDVYAAGDVAEGYDVLLGESRPVAIWPSAYLQGQVAGANMAGSDTAYEGSVAMNSIQICGLPTISVGLTNAAPGDEVLESTSANGRDYRRIVIRDGKIVGAIFVGDIDRAGIITGLIRDAIDVSDFKHKLIGRDLGMLSLPKDYRLHQVMGPGIEV